MGNIISLSMTTELLSIAERLHKHAISERLSIDEVTEQYKLTFNIEDFVPQEEKRVLDRLAELQEAYSPDLVEFTYKALNRAVREWDGDHYDPKNSLALTEVALLAEVEPSVVMESYFGLRKYGFNTEDAVSYAELAVMNGMDHWV